MDPFVALRHAFLEECDDLMQALDRHVQELAAGSGGAAAVNAAFRAVHSIKGGAGAFGLTALAPFAHSFEAALDRLRGAADLTAAPWPLFLKGGDGLAALLAAAREDAPAPDLAETQRLLEAFAGGEAAMPGGGDKTRTVASGFAPAGENAPTPSSAGGHRIWIRPHASLFHRLVEVSHFRAALEAYGAVTLTCDPSQTPPLERLDPFQCHLRFEVTLHSEAPRAAIEEVLERSFDRDEFQFVAPGAVEAVVAESAPLVEAAPVAAMAPMAVPAPPGRPPLTRTVRVDLERVDRLMNQVGELVITQSMLLERCRGSEPGRGLVDACEALMRQTRDLQDQVMAVRAQPVRTVFQRMPRLVRELAETLGKQATLVMHGEATEIDKTIVEELADPLTHMIRNALDHGLESPAERLALGKPAAGQITLAAEQRGGRVIIRVSDDGRGLPRQKLLAKAIDRGLIAPGARLGAAEIDALIFHPGLSTADSVSAVSGRGVGMDVVRENIAALGGRVLVESTPGLGSAFTLSLPLTLAVLDGMLVRLGAQRVVIPIASIIETLRLDAPAPDPAEGGPPLVRLRGQPAPLMHLGALLGFAPAGGERVALGVETEAGPPLCLAVDEILGQQQVVVKSLEATVGAVAGAGAATILGDGEVALILDVEALRGLSTAPPALAPAMEARP
jgi:two-component system chemotaxis sensor kinase CheA